MPKITITDLQTHNEMKQAMTKERHHKYYEEHTKNAKIECACCCKMIHKYYFEEHKMTNKHKKCEEFQKKKNAKIIL